MKYRLPGDPLVCYFHNPFDQVIMEAVIGRLVESLREIHRELYVVYLNPKYRMLFDNSGLWDVISENDPDAIWEMEDFVIYRFCHQYNFKSTQMHTEAAEEEAEEAVI